MRPGVESHVPGNTRTGGVDRAPTSEATTDRRPPSADGIVAAAAAIDPVFLDSPTVAHDSLDEVLGCRLVAKLETLNPIRSFKGRGTDWYVRSLRDRSRPIVTASAGNFGQGLAYAARARTMPITVFAAETANPIKVAAMRRLGAVVRLVGRDFDTAREAAVLHAREEGGLLVIDGAEPEIAEGAGTIAYELTRNVAHLPEIVLIPLGNGALATGIGTWMKAERPSVEILAVSAEGAPAMATSWREGRAVETDRVDTIADGIATRVPVPYALDTMRNTVDGVLLVSDHAIMEAMRLVHHTLGLVVEPAGVAGLAAILADPKRFAGRRVATVFCGGNVTPRQIRDFLTPDSTGAGEPTQGEPR